MASASEIKVEIDFSQLKETIKRMNGEIDDLIAKLESRGLSEQMIGACKCANVVSRYTRDVAEVTKRIQKEGEDRG